MAKGKKSKTASKKKKSSSAVPITKSEGEEERCTVSLRRTTNVCPDRYAYIHAGTCGGNVCPPSFAAVPANSDVARIGKFRETCPTVIVVTPNISAAGDKNLPFVKNIRRRSIRDPGDCPCMVSVRDLSPLLVRSPPKRDWNSLPDAPRPGEKRGAPCQQPARRYPRCREDPPCFAEPCVGQCIEAEVPTPVPPLTSPSPPPESENSESTPTLIEISKEEEEEETEVYEAGSEEVREPYEPELEECEPCEPLCNPCDPEPDVCEPCESDTETICEPCDPEPDVYEPCEPENEPICESCESCDPEPDVCEPCESDTEPICEPCDPEPELCDPCDQETKVVYEPCEPEPVITCVSDHEASQSYVVCEPCEPEPVVICTPQLEVPQSIWKPCQPESGDGVPHSKEICQLSFNSNDYCSSSHNAVSSEKFVPVCFGPPENVGSYTSRGATYTSEHRAKGSICEKSTQSMHGVGRKPEAEAASLFSNGESKWYSTERESSESTDRFRCCPTDPGYVGTMDKSSNKSFTKYVPLKMHVPKTADAASSIPSDQGPMIPYHVPKTADVATSQPSFKISQSTSESHHRGPQSNRLQKPSVCKPCAETEKRTEVSKCKPCADVMKLMDIDNCKPCVEMEEPSQCKPCAQEQRKPPPIPPCSPCAQTRGGRTPTSLMSTALAVMNAQSVAYTQTCSKAMASTQTSKLMGTSCQPCLLSSVQSSQIRTKPTFTASDVIQSIPPIAQDGEPPCYCTGRLCTQAGEELRRQHGSSGASMRLIFPFAGEITPCCTPTPPLQPLSAISLKSIDEDVCPRRYGGFRETRDIGAQETSVDAKTIICGAESVSGIVVCPSEPSYTRVVCGTDSTRDTERDYCNAGSVKPSCSNIGRACSQSSLKSEPSYRRICVSRPEARPQEVVRENPPTELICGSKYRNKSGHCYGVVASDSQNTQRRDYSSTKFVCRQPSPRSSAVQENKNVYGVPKPKNYSMISGKGVEINRSFEQKRPMKGIEPRQEEVRSKQYTYASGENTNNWAKPIQKRTVACSIQPQVSAPKCRTSQYHGIQPNSQEVCSSQDDDLRDKTCPPQIVASYLQGPTYNGLQARIICEKRPNQHSTIHQPCDGGKVIIRCMSEDAQSGNASIQREIRCDDSKIKNEASKRNCASKNVGTETDQQRKCFSYLGTQRNRHFQRNAKNESSPPYSCTCSSCHSSGTSCSSRSYVSDPPVSKELRGSAWSVQRNCGSGRSDSSQQEDRAHKCIPVGNTTQPLKGVIKIVICNGDNPETSYKLQKNTDQSNTSDRNDNSEDDTEKENKNYRNIQKSSSGVCDSAHKNCSCQQKYEQMPKCVEGGGEDDHVRKRCSCSKYVEKASQCEEGPVKQRKFIICSGDNVNNTDIPNTELIRCPLQKCSRGRKKISDNNAFALENTFQNQKPTHIAGTPERIMDNLIDNTHKINNCPKGRLRINYDTPECDKIQSFKPDCSKCFKGTNLKLKSDSSLKDKSISKGRCFPSPVSRKIICMNIEEMTQEEEENKEKLYDKANESKIAEESDAQEEGGEEEEYQENKNGSNDTENVSEKAGTKKKVGESSKKVEKKTKKSRIGSKTKDMIRGSKKTEHEQEKNGDNTEGPKKCKNPCVAANQPPLSAWCGTSKESENCRDIAYTDRCGPKGYEFQAVSKKSSPEHCPGRGNIEICGKLACADQEVASQESKLNVKIMNLSVPSCPERGNQIAGPNFRCNLNGAPLARKPGQAGTVIILDKPKTSYPNFRKYIAPGTSNVPSTIPLRDLLDCIAPGTTDELPLALPPNLTVPDYSAMEITVISIAARENEPVQCEKIHSQYPRYPEGQTIPNVEAQQFPQPINDATVQIPYQKSRGVCSTQFPGYSRSSKNIQPTNQPKRSFASSFSSNQSTQQNNCIRLQEIAGNDSLGNEKDEKVNGNTKHGQEPFPGVPKTQNIAFAQILNQKRDQNNFQSKQVKDNMPDNKYLLDCDPPKACKKEISIETLLEAMDGPCPCPTHTSKTPRQPAAIDLSLDLSLEYRRVIDKHFHSVKGIIYTGHLEPLSAPTQEVKQPESVEVKPVEEDQKYTEEEETIAVVGLDTNMSLDSGKINTCKESCQGIKGENPSEIEPPEIEPPEIKTNSEYSPEAICKTSQQETGEKLLIRTVCQCLGKNAETNSNNHKSLNSTFSDIYDNPEDQFPDESREQSTSYHKMGLPAQNNRNVDSRHTGCHKNQETNFGHPYQNTRQKPTIIQHCVVKNSKQGECRLSKQNICKISHRKVCKSSAKNTSPNRQICKRSKTVACKRVTPATTKIREMKSEGVEKPVSIKNQDVHKQPRFVYEPPPSVYEQPPPNVENLVPDETAPVHCPSEALVLPKCAPPPGRMKASCMPGTYRLCREDSEDCTTRRIPAPKKETPLPLLVPVNRFEEQLLNRDVWQKQENATTDATFAKPSLLRRWDKVETLIDDPVEEQCNRWRQCAFVARQRYGPRPCIPYPVGESQDKQYVRERLMSALWKALDDDDQGGAGSKEDRKSLANYMQTRLMSTLQHKLDKK